MKTYILAPFWVMGVGFKLEKHIGNNDPSRVIDYLILLGAANPDLEEHPLDPGILERSLKLLAEKGHEVKVCPNNGLHITIPDSTDFYRSHKNGVAKKKLMDQVKLFPGEVAE